MSVRCPYDDQLVPAEKFCLHLARCRRKYVFSARDAVDNRRGYEVNLVRCRYNGVHFVPDIEIALHEAMCKDERAMRIEDEMSSFDPGEPTPLEPIPLVKTDIGGKKLPDRWKMYNAIGKRIAGTRFLPFKAPLDSSFFSSDANPDDVFTVDIMLSKVDEMSERLGIVIDLTNTSRYYDRHLVLERGIEHQKIRCPGHEVDFRDDLAEEFVEVVDSFLERNMDNDLLIGVHCTHGLNRTGYLICKYLTDRMNWSVDSAIQAFEDARGYEIERETYKSALHGYNTTELM